MSLLIHLRNILLTLPFVKICDVLGKEVKKTTKNQALFYIYNDGSVEKKYFKE